MHVRLQLLQKDQACISNLLAATPEVAARLAGVTLRQLNYWREIGLIEPAVAR